MLFLMTCFLFVAVSMLLFKKAGTANPFSKGIAMAIALSIVALVCLAQNYSESLIPEASDGIGISNPLAYWIIGEGNWSVELFRARFEQSIFVSLSLIILYPLAVLAESRFAR
jgi:hypothetical protein